MKIPSFKWKRARIGNIGSMSGTVREMCGLISIQPSRFWCIITASYFEICMTNNTAAVHVVCYLGGSLSRVSQATRDLQFVIKTVWKCDVEIDVYLGTFPPEKCGLVKSRLGNFLSFFFFTFPYQSVQSYWYIIIYWEPSQEKLFSRICIVDTNFYVQPVETTNLP